MRHAGALLLVLVLAACGADRQGGEQRPPASTVPIPVTIVEVPAPPPTIVIPPDITIPAPPPVPVVPPVTIPPRVVSPIVTVPVPPPVTTIPPPPIVSPWLTVMNADRAAAGLRPLVWSVQLAGFALTWARQLALNGVLTHSNLQATIIGTSWYTMGENVLTGPASLSPSVGEAAWMASPLHRSNILSGTFVAAGVGIAIRTDGTLWVVVTFGG